MFTGIVTDIGTVLTSDARGDGLKRLQIGCAYEADTIALGASIACSGTCLTVVEKGVTNGQNWFAVDAAAETLRLTTVGSWQTGRRINLERALKVGDELGGHIVSGHVDSLAVIERREDFAPSAENWGATAKFTLRVPQELKKFVAPKGSVALDGVSLTVNGVADDLFDVLLIPHTLSVTTFGERQAGDRINFEVDLMARYAARLSETR